MKLTSRDKAFSLSVDDFTFICQFVHQYTGIVLNENKREMVYRRLTRIIRERKLASFYDYCQLLRQQPEQEKGYFINAITTNLTSFFREHHHFEYLVKREIPRFLKEKQYQNNGKKRLRIWSCASSTGEEAYSIAITLFENMQHQLPSWDAKILATDIDSNVLATGKQGIYDACRIENLDEPIQQQYFIRGEGEHENQVKAVKQIAEMITFKQLNLLNEWPMKGKFDVIFCRNVIIYFNKHTQQALFARFYALLEPGGLLILGHSENLGAFQQKFEVVGRTMFRKPFA